MEETFNRLPIANNDEHLFQEQLELVRDSLLTDLELLGEYENLRIQG